jgi:hypothetical protein
MQGREEENLTQGEKIYFSEQNSHSTARHIQNVCVIADLQWIMIISFSQPAFAYFNSWLTNFFSFHGYFSTADYKISSAAKTEILE